MTEIRNDLIIKHLCRYSIKAFLKIIFREVSSLRYIHNWHIEAIAEHLQAIANKDISKLIINIPPGSFKSTIANQIFSAWMLGREPHLRIRSASHSHNLSKFHHKKAKDIILSSSFRKIFSDVKITKATENIIETGEGGFKVPDSAGAMITGGNADGIIADDLLDFSQARSIKEIEKINEWYENAFKTRLRPHPDITPFEVIIMQRLHSNDLTGYLTSDPRKGYEHLVIKAFEEVPKPIYFFKSSTQTLKEIIRPSQYISESLSKTIDEIKAQNPLKFAVQYQQTPLVSQGNIIKEAWLFEKEPPRSFDKIFLSVDSASKPGISSDYTVIITFGIFENKLYIIDLFREKVTFPELTKIFENLYKKSLASLALIEDKASGTALIQTFKNTHNIKPIIPVRDKEIRLLFASDLIAAKKLILPANKAFNKIIIEELTSFPNAQHDDIVDAITQAINWFITLPITPKFQLRIRRL